MDAAHLKGRSQALGCAHAAECMLPAEGSAPQSKEDGQGGLPLSPPPPLSFQQMVLKPTQQATICLQACFRNCEQRAQAEG